MSQLSTKSGNQFKVPNLRLGNQSPVEISDRELATKLSDFTDQRRESPEIEVVKSTGYDQLRSNATAAAK
jgi:hypothetical protein